MCVPASAARVPASQVEVPVTTSPAPTGRHAHAIRTRALALVASIALLGIPPVARPAAAADAGWYDGGIQYSQVTNCFSIIGGYPYLEYGAGVYTGYYADPTAGIPAVGQVYYVHVVFYGMGSPCAGQYAVPEIDLPNNTTLAIDASHPIVCYGTVGGGWIQDTTSCPTNVGVSGWHPGAFTLLPKTGETAWPLPAGAGWDLRIPVVSSSVLVNATMNANVWLLDGESSPWLTPWQGVYVWDAGTPSVMYASPPVEPIGRTTATTTAFVTSAFQAGTVHYQIGETTAYEFAHQTDPLPSTDSSWKVWWDWTGLKPDTVYHYRIWFQATGTGTIYDGGDRTFRTLGAATRFAVTGLASGLAGGTKQSVTVTAKDATGVTSTTFRGTVRFSSSDVHAGLPRDYTFTAADNGTHTFTNGVTLMTAGTHEVRVRDRADSAVEGAKTGLVVTSTVAPPTASLTKLPVTRTSLTIPLTWAGTGAASYDVQYRRAAWNGGFGTPVFWKWATTATSGTVTASKGYTYCFSVRSRAASGGVSAWTPETCTTTPIDDRAMTRTGTWTLGSSTSYFEGTYSRSTTTGDRLTRTGARYSKLYLVAATCPTCGIVRVYAGSTLLKEINLYSATTAYKVRIAVKSFATPQSGTLSVRVKTGKVIIDGLIIAK